MFRLILLGLICFSHSLFAQDYVGKFSFYVPDIVVENQGIRNGINESITLSAEVNPFLISDEINFANNFFGKKLMKPDESGINKIRKLKSYHLAKESIWADSILQIIKAADLHYIVKFRLRSTFTDIYDEDAKLPDSLVFKQMSNFDYYFVYVYLSGIEKPEYNRDADYHDLMDKEVSRIISEMDKEAEFFPNMSDREQNDFLDKIISYHYLFTDNRFNAKFNISIKDLVNIAYRQTYKSRSHIALTGSYTIGNWYKWSTASAFSYTFLFSNGFSRTFDFPFSSVMTLNYFIGINYKQSLKENVSWLNYLKLGVQFVHVTNAHTEMKGGNDLFAWTYKYESGAYYEKVFKGKPQGNVDGYMINGYAAVPLFYFSKDLNIEAGVMVNLNEITAKYSTGVDDVKVTYIRTIVGTENVEKNIKWNKTEVSYLFTIIYKVLPYVNISAQGILNGSMAGAMIGTSLGFDL